MFYSFVVVYCVRVFVPWLVVSDNDFRLRKPVKQGKNMCFRERFYSFVMLLLRLRLLSSDRY